MVLVFWQTIAKLDSHAPLLQVEVTAVGDDESDRAKVAQEIMQVRKKKGGLKVVQGRGLQLGDAALIDFDAKRSDTGEEFPGAKRRKTHMDTDSADMQFLPGRVFDPKLSFVTAMLSMYAALVRLQERRPHAVGSVRMSIWWVCLSVFIMLMSICCVFCSHAVFGRSWGDITKEGSSHDSCLVCPWAKPVCMIN